MRLERRLAMAYLDEHPSDAALALERMTPDQRAGVLREAPMHAAAALGEMAASSAAECLARLTADEAAPALDRLALDAAIALLRRLPVDEAERLTGGLPDAKQESVRRVLRYPEGTAGALMDPAVLSLPDDIAVGEARVRLRREARGLLHYLFIVDRERRLVGVLDIPELMRARSRESIRSAMHDRVEHLAAWTPAAAVRAHPGWRSFHAMPVTDERGRLVGAIRYQTLRRLEHDAALGRGTQPTSVTAGALGELFHIGMAGFVEGVAAAAAPRAAAAARGPAAPEGGAR